jgi:transcriptional regulator with XRE-family HTH domain
VRKRRKELGISMDQLASRSGLHRTYLNEVELGKRNIALENIERLAKALDLPLSKLFEDVE